MTIIESLEKIEIWRIRMSQTVSISEFKARCLALLDLVKKTGQPLLITKRGEPIAQVVPPPEGQKPPSWLGCMRGTGIIVGDIVSPATDEDEWEALAD
jgi:prevent-host-death family protein